MSTVLANPEGGHVSAGNAVISSPNSNTVLINQSSDKAIIDWHSFNIAHGEKTQFQQPSASSITLNRINPSQGASQIFGQLTANGKVILVNQAGIFFGPNARVDVGGIISSTSDISNANFMTGKYIFDQPSLYSGSVINKGTIKAGDAGLVALIGTSVKNDGLIVANTGTVILASGNKFILGFSGDGLINFAISAPATNNGVDVNGKSLSHSVSNSGKIIANGGKIIMTAKSVNGVLNSTINMSGILIANSVKQKNGVIILSADKGTTRVTGKIYASGKHMMQKGGNVQILGKNVILANKAKINVSGNAGGGEILIGGDYHGKNSTVQNAENTFIGNNVQLFADATKYGNGGKVIIWADTATQFYGSIFSRGGNISGNGGFVEVSGKENLVFNGIVNTLAPFGQTGILLLDPKNITVANGGTASLTDVDNFNNDPGVNYTIAPSTINSASSNVILQANNDIKFNDSVGITTSGISLTAQAGRDITLASGVSISTNNADVILIANAIGADTSNRQNGTGDITMNGNTSINTGTGNITLRIENLSGGNPGKITVRGLSTTSGNITIDGLNAVTINSGAATNTINSTSGIISIKANQIGTGGQDFSMSSGTKIVTGNTTANAIQILVNNGGGTGLANLRDIATGVGGTLTVRTDTNGNLSGSNITLQSGTLSVGNLIFSSNANVTLSGSTAIQATGIIDISANTSGTGGQDFNMQSGSSITTSDTSVNAVSIKVNTAAGGTGSALLRDITTGSGGTITIQTDTGGNTTGNDITQASGTLNVGTGAITLTTPKINGSNIGTNGSNIMTRAGILNATAGSSGIFINNISSNNLSLGTIDTSGSGGSAQIISNGAISQSGSGVITVTGLTIKTKNDPGADITITNTGNTVGDINLQSRNSGDTANANGIITYRDTAGLTISGLNTTNSANIIAGNAVTQNGDIAVSSLIIKTLNDSGAAITLSRSGNEVSSIDLRTRNAADTTNSAGAITYRDATGFDIENISTTSTLDLTAGGSITQSGALSVTSTPTFTIRSGNFDILLASAANSFLTTPIISTASGGSILDFALRNTAATAQVPTLPSGMRNLTLIFNNTGITLPAVSLTGNLAATAGGAIAQSGALLVNGTSATSTFTAGSTNNVTLTNALNDFATFKVVSGNNVNVTDINSIILGASSVSGNLMVNTTGFITQSGALTVSGLGKTATFTAGSVNNITLNNASNNFASIIINSGNDVNIRDVNAIILGASSISGNLTVTANGAITQSGVLTVNGIAKTATFAAGGSNNITLNNINNDFTTVAITSGNNVILTDINTIDLSASSVSGTYNITANGSITNSGMLNITGIATLSAGTANNITLDNNNDFKDAVKILSANNVTLNDVDDLDLGASTINGTLNVTSSGDITNSGALNITGVTTINSNGYDISLNNVNNNFSTISASGRDVSITDINALVLGASAITGNLDVNTSGAITQSGALSVNGTGKVATFSSGSGNNITLTNSANDFTTAAFTTGNDVNITDSNALMLGSSSISGNFTVNTNGAITQNAAIIVNGSGKTTSLSASSAGAITLTNTANDFTVLNIGNALSANIRDLNNLTLSGISVAQNFTSVVGGSLTTTGLIQTAGGNVNLATTDNGLITIGSDGIKTSLDQVSNGGNIQITAANTDSVDPAIIINGILDTRGGSGGVLTIGGSVQLNQAPNVGAGNITLRGMGTSTTIGTINFTSATTISTLDADIIINGAVTSTGAGSDLSFLADTNDDGLGGVRITSSGSVNSSGNLTISGSDLFINPGVAVEFQSGSSVQAAGTISISGNVGNSDLLLNGGIQSTSSGSSITLNAAGTGITQLGANVTSNNGTVTFSDAVNILSNITWETNGGSISANNAINGEGKTLTVNVGNGTDVSFTNANNNFGTIAITNAKNVSLVDSAQIDLGASTVAGTFDLTSGGNVTDSGPLSISGTSTFSAGSNNITLNSATNNFSTIAVNGRNVTLVDTNVINLGASIVTGFLNVSAGGNITNSGALNITGIATFNAGSNDITLNNTNIFDRVRLIANNATISDSSALRLGISSVNGDLTVTANGNITNIGPLTIGGISEFNVGNNNVTLDQANDFNTVKVTSAKNVILNDTTPLDLGTSNINGTLSVTTIADITNNNGAVAVAGETTLNTDSTSNITLANSNNNFSTITIPGSNNVNVTDVSSLDLGESSTNDLTVIAGGNITQSGPLTITGTPTFTVTLMNSDILLASAANDFTLTPVITNNGNVRDLALRNTSFTAEVPTLPSGLRNLTLQFDNNSIVLPVLVLTGNGTAISGGTITQSGSLNISGLLSTNSVGGTTLNNASNTINSVNATNSASGTIRLTNTATAFTITGITQNDGGNITISNVGTLIIANSASINSGNNNITLSATDLDLGASGTINSGTGNLTIQQNTNGGILVLGNGSGNMVITGSELARMTANNLTFNTLPDSQIIVDGVTSNNLNNISGTVLLSAATTSGTLGNIIFRGTPSSFKTLTANANNGITIDTGLTTTTGNLILNADADETTATNDKLSLNANLSSASDLSLSAKTGGIILGSSVSLSGVNITFNDKLDGTFNLTLNTGSIGNITFVNDVGSVTRLSNVTVNNANNVTMSGLFNAVNFLQQSGSGTTDFGTPGINLSNNATIKTDTANGTMDVRGLSLNTNFANLNGLVNGLSGQAAINIIRLLNNISPGTHFFDGIDMYSNPAPMPPSPNVLSLNLLYQIPQITFSYLYGLSENNAEPDIEISLSTLQILQLLSDLDTGKRKCVRLGLFTICSEPVIVIPKKLFSKLIFHWPSQSVNNKIN